MKQVRYMILCFVTATGLYGNTGKFVDYKIDGVSYEGYFADAGAGAPLLLLIHDWDGLTEHEVRRTEMLNRLGYSVFALDLFGKGVRPEETAGMRKLTGALYADRKKMRRLMEGALETADSLGGNIVRAAALGYCFGGSAVLELARSGAPLMAFVSFHGGLETPEGQDYSQVRGSILILHGSADSAVPMERFAEMALHLEAAGIHHEMISYSGAKHAFTVFGGSRYHEEADLKSWNRFTEFLEELFK